MQDERVADETPEVVAEVIEAPRQQKEKAMAAKDSGLPPSSTMPASPTEVVERGVLWMDLTSKNIGSMLMALQGTMDHLRACQEMTLGFVRDRVRKSQEYRATLLSQEGLEGIVHASAGYQRSMVEDYVRYVQRLGDMTLTEVNKQMEPLESRVQETVGKLSKAA